MMHNLEKILNLEYQSFVDESFTEFAIKEEFTWLSTLESLVSARSIANFQILSPYFVEGRIFAFQTTSQTIVFWLVTPNFDLN